MRITFDPEVDAAYIYLTEIAAGEAVRQEPVPGTSGSVILDFDRDGRLLGIEALDASQTLPQELLDQAERR